MPQKKKKKEEETKTMYQPSRSLLQGFNFFTNNDHHGLWNTFVTFRHCLIIIDKGLVGQRYGPAHQMKHTYSYQSHGIVEFFSSCIDHHTPADGEVMEVRNLATECQVIRQFAEVISLELHKPCS